MRHGGADLDVRDGTGEPKEVQLKLGDDADYLLDHEATAIGSSALTLPGPDFVDDVLAASDRSGASSRRRRLLASTSLLTCVLPPGRDHESIRSRRGANAFYDDGFVTRRSDEIELLCGDALDAGRGAQRLDLEPEVAVDLELAGALLLKLLDAVAML